MSFLTGGRERSSQLRIDAFTRLVQKSFPEGWAAAGDPSRRVLFGRLFPGLSPKGACLTD